ncbi:hypothetical protein ACFQFH_16240 [Halobaculum halobium]|uniref:hypothetical protein n=1 Tax=Halobaculum halobium TaxID=3032281 RepID=UPI00360BA682
MSATTVSVVRVRAPRYWRPNVETNARQSAVDAGRSAGLIERCSGTDALSTSSEADFESDAAVSAWGRRKL